MGFSSCSWGRVSPAPASQNPPLRQNSSRTRLRRITRRGSDLAGQHAGRRSDLRKREDQLQRRGFGHSWASCRRSQLMTPEQLGNFLYGYIGATAGFSLTMLRSGSLFAMLTGDAPNLSDEIFNDWPMIRDGFNAFGYR